MTDTPSRRKSATFLWGLAAGFLVTLALVVVNDMHWQVIPITQKAQAGDPVPLPESVRAELRILDGLPAGTTAWIDDAPARLRTDDTGTAILVEPGSRRVTMRNPFGTLWSARIDVAPASIDTLRPAWGGEIVVELQRHAPAGEVHLDGVPRGAAPLVLTEVAPGWRMLSVENGEEIYYQAAVEVTTGQVSLVSVPPAPPRGHGRLTVGSRMLREKGFVPTKGNPIQIDGKPAGRTPFEGDLPAGFHSVTVEQKGFDPFVNVLFLPAGQTRQIEAEFGREDMLRVSVLAPSSLERRRVAALPITIDARGETVRLASGELFVVPVGQTDPVSVPLVPSGTDPKLFVAVIPGELLRAGPLTGYATCVDEANRTGVSELFQIPIR